MDASRILTQFKDEAGNATGSPFDLPLNVTVKQLQLLCNHLLKQEEQIPYTFYVNDKEITDTLSEAIDKQIIETEKVLDIIYQPQAIFRVRPVTRCTSSLPGHAEAVISSSFNANGSCLASGSGDTTVRFWDLTTETPHFVCKGHSSWVLSLAWAPDGKKLASGCKNGQILIWNPATGKQIGKPLSGHKQWITCLSWEPLHWNVQCQKLASSSKDCTVRIWNVPICQTLFILSGHTQSVTCVRWGGSGLIYTASQDRTIKVWRSDDGVLCRTLQAHGHWVNTLALNTDYALRIGAFEPEKANNTFSNDIVANEETRQKAQQQYDKIKGNGPECLVSGSDDFTLRLWHPENNKQPICCMTGHQQLINDVKFSPDGRIIASASFDKSIKLWNGLSGKFIATLRGHVQSVYQISWSADSRLLVSGSADSTLKLWDIATKKLLIDLPGHADEVYTVDWSPDGQRIVSGGKDKILKIWRK